MSLMTRHRQLTWEMTKREMKDRYAGQAFGSFWTIGHPLILLLFYTFIFTYVFPWRAQGQTGIASDQPIYILSGLIPWLAFQDTMSKSCTVIVSNSNLVKQVIFPIEILPVKGVLTSLATQLIGTIFLICYVLVNYHVLPLTYLLLIYLVIIQAMAMVGISYVFASVGVYFKDLKDFVGLFLTMGIFMAPILYHPGMLPKPAERLLFLNPFSHMVWCYQDACYFGAIQHPWSWFIFAVFSVISFYGGYRVFRKLKIMFGNVL